MMEFEARSSLEDLEARWTMREGHVRGILKELARVEEDLRRIGYLLSVSQPPGEGKIGLRWWKDSTLGRERLIEPVLVRWVKTQKDPKARKPVRLNGRPKKIYDHGRWGINAQETRELVDAYYLKRSEWDALVELLREVTDGRWNRKARTVMARIEALDLEDLRNRINTNLEAAGYVGGI